MTGQGLRRRPRGHGLRSGCRGPGRIVPRVAGGVLAAMLPLLAAGPAVAAPAAPAACAADPLDGRAVYLRGSFNAWGAPDAQRFAWSCNRWVLVTRLQGEHRFKVGDEGWSADADYGSTDGRRLVRRGPELQQRFSGTYRFTVTMSDPDAPELRIDECPAGGPPPGAPTLFLRGTPNNWAALDDFQFQFSCDAYYLNVRLAGRHEFKIADAAWSEGSSFGASADQKANFVHDFTGEHTVRVVVDAAARRATVAVGPRTFADPRARAVTDPVALSLRFDSRDRAHKRPFGAITPGTAVDYAVTAQPGVEALTLVVETRRMEGNQEVLEYTPAARVPMTRAARRLPGGRERWTARHRFDAVAVHGWWFEATIAGRRYALQNNADPVYWTREKGTMGRAEVGPLPGDLRAVRRFRQTVYRADFRAPDWAPDIVYYYVFPERFRNGNPSNDPVPGRDRYRNTTVEKHPRWIGQPYKPGSGDGSDATFNNDFFGGDLAGLIDKLDDIRELGANTLYMTPVFQAPSNHKYDTADYTRIDPAFGSNADFERLAREGARRGIRVIPDTSLNHTGSDSIYFNRYGNHASRGAFDRGKPDPGSPWYGWYRFDPAQADPDKQYRGWVGVTDLPELDKSSADFRRFAYGAKDSVMLQWLDRGAAGWRMDVAPWVPDDFWREWRAAIKAHRPDALTVAETWFDASKYFLGDTFDSTMNYIFRNAVLDWAAGGKAQVMVDNLELTREAYPEPAFFALMNLLSTHDQARSLHHFGWSAQHGNLGDRPAEARAKQRLRLAVLLQMTWPGSPTVYYGDEVGVTGGDDPYNRAPYPWADEGGEPDLALRADFRRLIAMRHAHPVLRRGELLAPLFVDDQVAVFARRLAAPGGRSTWALTAFSNAGEPRRVRVKLPAGAPQAWRDITPLLQTMGPTAGPAASPAASPGAAAPSVRASAGRLELTVPAGWGRVLVAD